MYVSEHNLPSSLTLSLIKLFCGRSLVSPTFVFLNGLKNFVTVDIFMMSVNKKDLLFRRLCGRLVSAHQDVCWSQTLFTLGFKMGHKWTSVNTHRSDPIT